MSVKPNAVWDSYTVWHPAMQEFVEYPRRDTNRCFIQNDIHIKRGEGYIWEYFGSFNFSYNQEEVQHLQDIKTDISSKGFRWRVVTALTGEIIQSSEAFERSGV